MSVQDGDKVVHKQDLADFYDRILPYLGGMPEMLANKFSKGDIYSTSEKMIGQWIDGKPLYKRTWSVDLALQGGGKESSYTLSDIANMDMVYLLDSCAMPDSDPSYSTIFLGRLYAGLVYRSNNTVRFGQIATNTDNLYHTKWFTLMYTKTTDSAISIGDETDYSTEEKIVGTWIDGKPIYQIVVITTSELALEDNTWLTSPITISNIETVIDGTLIDTGGNKSAIWVGHNNDTILLLASRRNTWVAGAKLILQYTKTT